MRRPTPARGCRCRSSPITSATETGRGRGEDARWVRASLHGEVVHVARSEAHVADHERNAFFSRFRTRFIRDVQRFYFCARALSAALRSLQTDGTGANLAG